jgi:serine/threonine protein kinase
LWNHDHCRALHVEFVPGQPAVPFHSTFRFCFAFIDFGSAVQFSPDAADHLVTAEHMPPSHFAAPEQTQSEPYDIFASDVFNVGRVLQTELEEAKEVRTFSLSPDICCLDDLKQGNLAAINTPTLAPLYMDLLQNMTRSEPSMRLKAAEALESLITIITDLPSCVDGNTIP